MYDVGRDVFGAIPISITLKELHYITTSHTLKARRDTRGTVAQSSDHSRQHSECLLLVFRPKLFAVPSLLLLRPDSHLRHCRDDKHTCAQTEGHQPHADPSHRLEQIVGTSHQAETNALRDTALRAARAAQTPEHKMRVQIAQLADDEESNSDIDQQRASDSLGRSAGLVAPEGDVGAAEQPIV